MKSEKMGKGPKLSRISIAGVFWSFYQSLPNLTKTSKNLLRYILWVLVKLNYNYNPGMNLFAILVILGPFL